MESITITQLSLLELETLLDNSIKRVLSIYHPTVQSEADQLLTVVQAAEFLSLSVQTVYGLISKGAIPCMKRSKRVYFSKAELINYLHQGKRKTSSEIEAEADSFLSTCKKKGGKHA